MDITKFDYEINPEIVEGIESNKADDLRNSDEWDEFDKDYEKFPKKETYYIVYNNVEFVILAERIGFLEEYRRIVLENNGEFYNSEDVFFDSRDAERVVVILKKKFSDNNWFNSVLSKAIEKILNENSSYDDLTFNLIKKHFYMLDEETLYEAIIYLANK